MLGYIINYSGIFLLANIIALLIYLIVSREPTLSWLKGFAGVQASGINQAGSTLLVLSIAFFLNDATQIRQKASDVLLREADTLRTMGRVAANLPRDLRAPLLQRLAAYSDSILNEDWPRMENGVREQNSNTSRSLAAVINLGDFVLSNLHQFGHPEISQLMLSSVQKLRELRLQRLELSLQHPDAEKLVMALFCFFNALIALILTHSDRPRALFAAASLFIWLSFSALYTVFLMHNPYTGIEALSRAPIVAASERLRVMAPSSEAIFNGNPAR